MEDITPIASQEHASSILSASIEETNNPSSSPVLPQLRRQNDSKPRKPPTITPRSFTRFFTPKCSLERGGRIGASRQALKDITASAVNRKGRRTPNKDTILLSEYDVESIVGRSINGKRKYPVSIDTTPDHSSPLKRIRNQSLEIAEDEELDTESDNDPEDPLRRLDRKHGRMKTAIRPIQPSRYRQSLGRDLRQEIGTYGKVRKPWTPDACSLKEWQYETSNFFCTSTDSFVCTKVGTPTEYTNPFCTASCNTNSLVAIGDEDGGIRLLESAPGEKPGFPKAILIFEPHENAILDLAFSPDDLLLATASGDQTSQVIDMHTQRVTYSLAGHVSSVKQVRFQPGSSDVIATSSRDGSVQIWDLRCKGSETPIRDIRVSLEPESARLATNKMTWAKSINTIFEAHASRQCAATPVAATNKSAPTTDAPSKTESPGRRGDVSVTALSFLEHGREHLFLTASEANASVKLWDLRTTHNHRRSHAIPLSSTKQPDSHSKHRHFGLTSLSLSGDGSRLYTLCRDNTVYAYSTSHLILGHAPELSRTISKPRRSTGQEKEGLGPIYGFRHPKLHATTFYIKCALRPAQGDKSELLAVGSNDGCPIVFATDEMYMQRTNHERSPTSNSPFPRLISRPVLSRTDSGTSLSTRLEDTIPIYQHGSALVRGHQKEATALTWTQGGHLVTVGDDCVARRWQEGPGARDLRMCGDGQGKRWACAWAEAEDGWDDDDV